MKKTDFLFMALLMLACTGKHQETYTFTFQNPAVSVEERIDDLVSRLTTEEKASLMLYNSPSIDRLGIPEYNWWNECLHGVARAGKATVFPQAIGMAATFDDGLIFRIATAISDEARAKYNASLRKENRAQYLGLSFWTPNINIFRDPRWGRGQETYGEDPFLTAKMGVAFVQGLQGNDPDHLKTAACAKHYVVHSGPEKIRHHFNAVPPERDFMETYLPGFMALVRDAKVEAVMCAYNRTYDEPCCGSGYLLNDLLRKEWGFQGHIVSDCWALDDIWLRHKTVETQAEAAAMAAMAGVNLNCGYIYKYLPEAIEKNLIDQKILDEALRPLLRTRFRLGLFDPPDAGPWDNIPASVVNCEAHRKLAREAAVKSIVLLKNEGNVLPLSKEKIKNLLVLGPVAADVTSLFGNYNGFSGEMVTFLEGITGKSDAGTIVEYNQGFMFHNDTLMHGFWQAGRADAVIVCMGINSLYEGEEGDAMLNPYGGDRMAIELPGNQLEYLRKMKDKIGDKPLIVVLTGGSATAIPEIDSLANAILFAWYPGEQGGNALADILFGEVNPSGRLPVTFYRSTTDLPPFEDYGMEGRTYRYFRGEPLYPFGYGLSYSSFVYSEPVAATESDILRLSLKIRNAGEHNGEEVVQVYASKMQPEQWRPRKQLIGFQRVNLNKGEEKLVRFEIKKEHLRYWDVEKQDYIVEPGVYEIQAGSSSEDIRLTTALTLENIW
ncbi:MAG: glycoside hydrolase family 3 C-terminal domain-containing protein [Bacteroidales bacterium]|nr:glycoside hydrolase family 3 C-terminal domain-containing protein [Bacteroidales bacterium]